MSNTNFINQTTVIVADWLNDVNDVVYDVLGDGTNVPTSTAQVRTNLDVPQSDGTGASGSWNINAATATSISGINPISNGGTGQTTALAAFDALKQNATTTYVGAVELATSGEAAAGTDTTRAITPSALFGGLNAGGTAPIYACRAWVNFNGTGTVAIRSSGNVSSITDNGTGDYTINFTTAMSDANFSAITVASNGATSRLTCAPTVFAVGSVRIDCNQPAVANSDPAFVCASIFR